MYNTSNPAELYAGTTWELLPDNKFLKTGSTPLQQAGSNSIKIAKANLPTDKLQVESHSMTRGTMEITGSAYSKHSFGLFYLADSRQGAFYPYGDYRQSDGGKSSNWQYDSGFKFAASRSWTGSTSAASPYTSIMGSGTPLTINPEHITIKAWKRLS